MVASVVVRAQRVRLALVAGEVDGPVERVLEVELALDHVGPQRRVGVLEVGQPDVRAGVERVDRHLPVGRAGDLHPPVDEAGRRRRHPPAGVVADVRGLREEVERRPARQLRPAGAAWRPARPPAGRRARRAALTSSSSALGLRISTYRSSLCPMISTRSGIVSSPQAAPNLLLILGTARGRAEGGLAALTPGQPVTGSGPRRRAARLGGE